MIGKLEEELRRRGFADKSIARVTESGYFFKACATSTGSPHYSVSDALYGNKALSSSFDLEDFIRYLYGDPAFERLPPLNRVRVRSRADIDNYLQSERSQLPSGRGFDESAVVSPTVPPSPMCTWIPPAPGIRQSGSCGVTAAVHIRSCPHSTET